MPSYAELEMKTVQWGEVRGIVQNGKPVGQARKTVEESAEVLEATAKITLLRDMAKTIPGLAEHPVFVSQLAAATHEARDGIGDVLVTLIMCAAVIDVSVIDCLAQAYDEIKDRKGHLRPDGVFVKES